MIRHTIFFNFITQKTCLRLFQSHNMLFLISLQSSVKILRGHILFSYNLSILKRHVWDYFNPIIYCLWLHSNPILFPCYNCIQIPNFIFKLRIQNSKNLTISKQPSNTPRQDIRPYMWDLYSQILRTAKRSTAYIGVEWIAVIKEQYGRQCLFKSVVQL